jgi:hypothetical protein
MEIVYGISQDSDLSAGQWLSHPHYDKDVVQLYTLIAIDETAGNSIALNQLCIPNCIYEFSTLSIIELDKQSLQSASIRDFEIIIHYVMHIRCHTICLEHITSFLYVFAVLSSRMRWRKRCI